MIKVNGVVIPTPTNFNMEKYKITNDERNSLGNMIGDLINIKYKLVLSWGILSREELITLDKIHDLYSFSLEFPGSNGIVKGTYYASPIRANGIVYKNGMIPFYKDVTMDFIER